MEDIKTALIERFSSIFGYAPGDVYAPRIRNARSIICQGRYSRHDMIEIWDTSICANGQSGLVLTVESVCVNATENFTSAFIAPYADIEEVYIDEDSFLGVDLTALKLKMKHGGIYEISLDQIDLAKLKEFIEYARVLYQEAA